SDVYRLVIFCVGRNFFFFVCVPPPPPPQSLLRSVRLLSCWLTASPGACSIAPATPAAAHTLAVACRDAAGCMRRGGAGGGPMGRALAQRLSDASAPSAMPAALMVVCASLAAPGAALAAAKARKLSGRVGGGDRPAAAPAVAMHYDSGDALMIRGVLSQSSAHITSHDVVLLHEGDSGSGEDGVEPGGLLHSLLASVTLTLCHLLRTDDDVVHIKAKPAAT
ncbi:MAG: hypothetical protein P4L40_04845, partial [Terracidiphilus sp.]|nr:hypothetical protein [Terracidiphilus sp.]